MGHEFDKGHFLASLANISLWQADSSAQVWQELAGQAAEREPGSISCADRKAARFGKKLKVHRVVIPRAEREESTARAHMCSSPSEYLSDHVKPICSTEVRCVPATVDGRPDQGHDRWPGDKDIESLPSERLVERPYPAIDVKTVPLSVSHGCRNRCQVPIYRDSRETTTAEHERVDSAAARKVRR